MITIFLADVPQAYLKNKMNLERISLLSNNIALS